MNRTKKLKWASHRTHTHAHKHTTGWLTLKGLARMQSNSNILIAIGNINWHNHFGKLALLKLNQHISYYLVTPFLCIHQKEMCIYMHQNICTQMFTAALCKTAKNWKTTQ